ncbi:hypothetical protein FIC_00897 [Flavobacteriaceae bacterium 3519-10]|nr:hypothetical protein FIC_00897 [Flavobacteriaceae bacterium 3519-10]
MSFFLSLLKHTTMKKNLFILIACGSALSAQTVITKAFHDPIIGESAGYFTVNGTVDNSATGAGVTFSNGSLTQGTLTTTSYAAPTATELLAFPGSTIKMTAAGNTILYRQTATKLEITGLTASDVTLNFLANNGTVITYPAGFGYTETDQAQGTFTSSLASGLFRGTITNTADASGTLIVGTNTYGNVLRIKSVQSFNLHQSVDTFFLFPIGTITNTTFTYYNNTRKFPLLTYTSANISVPLLGINQSSESAQVLSDVFLNTASQAARAKIKIFPNPARETIQFSGDVSKYTQARIYNRDGKLIKTSDMKSEKIQVSELLPAAYLIEFSGKETQPQTVKFIKK